MKKKLVILGASAAVALLMFGGWALVQKQADATTVLLSDSSDLGDDAITAEEFVKQFYDDYLAIAGNDGAAKAEVAYQYVSTAVFEKMATYPANIDPLVCSDKKPDSYSVEGTTLSESGDVNVQVALKSGDKSTKITLTITEGDGIVISSFQCPN